MVVLKLMGGLGNQLFQYASAKALSKRLKCELQFDLTFLLNFDDVNFTKRKFELGVYKLDEKCISVFELKKIKIKLYFTKCINFFSRHIYPLNINCFNVYSNYSSIYDDNFMKLSKNIYLEGYFQSFKYFEHIRTDLISSLNLFQFIKDNKSYLNLYYELNSYNSVSIHVRRGDYASNSHINSIHGLCSLSYFHDAIDFIKSKIDNPVFFIFSDDIDWCIANFSEPNMNFLSSNEAPAVDLFLMSSCKHNIISNSSFSWWGAWLNSNTHKLVVAPKIWYLNKELNLGTRDLCPSEWIRL